MSEGVVVAIVSGILTLAGTIVTVILGNMKSMTNMEKNQAVTDTKIQMLTDEVKKHNNFAEQIPVMKTQIQALDTRVSRLEVNE